MKSWRIPLMLIVTLLAYDQIVAENLSLLIIFVWIVSFFYDGLELPRPRTDADED